MRTRPAIVVAMMLLGTTACGDDAGVAGGDAGAGGTGGGAGAAGAGGSGSPERGPGQQAWQLVPTENVASECGLDPTLLRDADEDIDRAYVVVRYGKLCHEYYPQDTYPGGVDTPEVVFSATKTLAATLTGAAAYRTRDLTRIGRKTGPLSDTDRVDHWLDSFTFNQDAQVGHVLGMVAHNDDLTATDVDFTYDAVGATQINRLNDVVAAAILQAPTVGLGASVHEFWELALREPLGMMDSEWDGTNPNKSFAFGWETTARDMARLGLLILDGGVYNGERLLAQEWVYRMTHPSFETGNTGYGYLTWLIARSNADNGDDLPKTTEPNALCTPSAIYNEFPHGLSKSEDCFYLAPYDCNQMFDVGVWYAAGLGGNYIIGHRGLDMVLVVKNIGGNNQYRVWDAIRPALVAMDPTYMGDEQAFCDAYAAGNYAPDL